LPYALKARFVADDDVGPQSQGWAAAYAAVTLTGVHNVRAKLRNGEELNLRDKLRNDRVMVSLLRSLHDEQDGSPQPQAHG
jgi:hypothetical protein